jgi:redox-sensitive bicupin YhaK (pirin superfamily)
MAGGVSIPGGGSGDAIPSGRRGFLRALVALAIAGVGAGCRRAFRAVFPGSNPMGGDAMNVRAVVERIEAVPTLEGAGVHLHRVFGFQSDNRFDPFLLLDDFRGDHPSYYAPGFPWHPHRGIETITYVTAGEVDHGDSLGNRGTIGPGDVQWMTAGSGIVHQEMPRGDAQGRMHGFQLWANLPAADKMMDPRYRDVTAADIPSVSLPGGVEVKVVAGEVAGVRGPVQDVVIDPEYLDVVVPPGATFEHAVPAARSAFAYVFQGAGRFGPASDAMEAGNRMLVRFGEGEAIRVESGDEGVSFLLVSGVPLREPVAWRGPIVMNTQEELEQAFREYRDGTFLRHGR